jgi:hypothetical protein
MKRYLPILSLDGNGKSLQDLPNSPKRTVLTSLESLDGNRGGVVPQSLPHLPAQYLPVLRVLMPTGVVLFHSPSQTSPNWPNGKVLTDLESLDGNRGGVVPESLPDLPAQYLPVLRVLMATGVVLFHSPSQTSPNSTYRS